MVEVLGALIGQMAAGMKPSATRGSAVSPRVARSGPWVNPRQSFAVNRKPGRAAVWESHPVAISGEGIR